MLCTLMSCYTSATSLRQRGWQPLQPQSCRFKNLWNVAAIQTPSAEVNSPVDVTINGPTAEVANKLGWPGTTDTYRLTSSPRVNGTRNGNDSVDRCFHSES